MTRPIDTSTPSATTNEIAQAAQMLMSASELLRLGLERLQLIADALLAEAEADEREGK